MYICMYVCDIDRTIAINDYKQETEGRELVQHCILLSNSLPSKLGARCNLDVKYDGLKMDGIAEEMKKVVVIITTFSY